MKKVVYSLLLFGAAIVLSSCMKSARTGESPRLGKSPPVDADPEMTAIRLDLYTRLGLPKADPKSKEMHPPPGSLIDIGGYRLHLYCTGQAKPGRPTVVFEAGAGNIGLVWFVVQQGLDPAAQVCVYDRAGTGWSEPSLLPRDMDHIVGELHTLLDKARISRPLLLVGHSYGGPMVRTFERMYPNEVSGLVLVDPSDEEPGEMDQGFDQKMYEENAKEIPGIKAELLKEIGKVEKNQDLTDQKRGGEYANLLAGSLFFTLQALKEIFTEYSFFHRSLAEVRANPSQTIKDKPLTVISAEKGELSQFHPAIAATSTKGKHIVAAGSDHMVQQDRPDVVIEAVKEMLAELE